MEYYKEYPIRCKTCNEQLACFADDYEQYLQAGSSPEEALNLLGITLRCSRIAMVNPTIVCFNMENREVIEGFKSVDAAEQPDLQFENSSQPVFSSCLNANIIQSSTLTRSNLPPRSLQVNTLTKSKLSTQPGSKTIGLVQPSSKTIGLVQPSSKTIGLVQPSKAGGARTLTGSIPLTLTKTAFKENEPVIPDIISDPNLEHMESLGEAIPVNAPEITEFQTPVQVGIPTINHDPTIPLAVISVGANKQVRILNGRTYLAR